MDFSISTSNVSGPLQKMDQKCQNLFQRNKGKLPKLKIDVISTPAAGWQFLQQSADRAKRDMGNHEAIAFDPLTPKPKVGLRNEGAYQLVSN